MEPLYGRDDVLDRARALLERAFAGQGHVLLFTGEPGIGKSRLAEQVALEAAERGAAVAWGRCWEAGGAPAYWPWIQVFRELDMDEDPFLGAALELAVEAPEARFAAFDRAVRSLRARAAKRALVLVLDDLHAADAPSLLLLLLLAQKLSRSPLLVVGAYRDAELRRTPEIAALLARLAREADVLPLPRLLRGHVASWMHEALKLSEHDPARAAELYQLTEGQPLFVVEALRLARAAQAPTAWSRGPHALLAEHLGRLSPDARGVLEVAAVLGREFSLTEIVGTANIAADRVHAALKEALASSILVPGDAAERARFSHLLLRDHLYAELAPSARATLHFQAGSAILARGGDVQLAVHHLFESAGPSPRIAEAALLAAQAALSRLAFEDAARLGRRALALPGASELPLSLRGQLELVVAEALIRLGESVEGKALCVQAAANAERAGNASLLARAALAYGTELATATLDARMIALLRTALAVLPEEDSALRARVLARLCVALTPPAHRSHIAEIVELMGASLAMARRLDDPHALLYVLQLAATVGLTVPERERFALLEETLALARALDQPLVLLHTLPAYLTQLLALGERARVEALLPDYAALLDESRQPSHRVRYLCLRALLATLRGDFDEADRLGSEARLLTQSVGGISAHYVVLTHRLAVAQLRAEPGMLTADSGSLSTLLGAMPSLEPFLCWYLAGTGRHEDARARLRALRLEPSGGLFPSLWELHAAAEACVLLGDAELGEQLYPDVERAADRMLWTMSSGAIVGPSARALGDLAALIGRIPDALRHYDAAIAFCEKMGAPALLATCQRARERARGAQELAKQTTLASAVGPELTLLREGEVWTLRSRSGTIRLKHGKGLDYLQHLLSQPGRAAHVLELAGIEQRAGDAGPVLDAKAKAAYRARLEILREQLAEAEQAGDAARASRAEHEIAALAEQLATAVGLGGRDRRAASDVERTRINVQRRLKDAIDRIASADPALGRYLSAAVKTGTLCVYQPL